jgi:hypothetical protein
VDTSHPSEDLRQLGIAQNYCQRTGISAGWEFIDCQARPTEAESKNKS